MRTEISKTFQLESAHRLPHVPPGHKCARIHGHSFRITLVVGGEVDPVIGWIVDFADIEEAWKPLHTMLDHQYLNDVAGLENPTSENLARFVFERVTIARARLVSVTVEETCAAACTLYA